MGLGWNQPIPSEMLAGIVPHVQLQLIDEHGFVVAAAGLASVHGLSENSGWKKFGTGPLGRSVPLDRSRRHAIACRQDGRAGGIRRPDLIPINDEVYQPQGDSPARACGCT